MDQKVISEEGIESSPQKKVKGNPNGLLSLKDHTTVVADTGRINEIEKFKPQDATTNPSLILEGAKLGEYEKLIDDAVKQGIESYLKSKIVVIKSGVKRSNSRRKSQKQEEVVEKVVENDVKFDFKQLDPQEQNIVIGMVTDQLSVNFGIEILKLVPGYVSTEVDARLSYDKQGTYDKAKRIIQLYQNAGIGKDRILIKIASTWEGIQAAKSLKKDGIMCNMTLIFNFHQAVACAQSGVKLISPFVGRILDWFKKNKSDGDYNGNNHPGVKVVSDIWNYFKKYNHDTIVMAASLRTVEECEELCGCDRMTIPIKVLDDLQNLDGKILEPKLLKTNLDILDIPKIQVDEKLFRWALNQDPMANEKLTEGIRKFAQDLETLETVVRDKLQKL